MTLFLLGFLSAVALIAITLILYALRGYYRQERHRQASVDAIMAKVAQDSSKAHLKAAIDSWPGDSKGNHLAPLKRKDTH